MDIELLLGTTVSVFIGATVVLSGGAAFMMGQAIAQSWGAWWHNILYGALLALASQFLSYALFDGAFIVASFVSSEAPRFDTAFAGYVMNAIILIAIALFAYRVTKARQMVNQYPWLYERAGLFGWRDRQSG
ncbi:MAG: DUF6867 family protein [Dongiaceae bacterium]